MSTFQKFHTIPFQFKSPSKFQLRTVPYLKQDFLLTVFNEKFTTNLLLSL